MRALRLIPPPAFYVSAFLLGVLIDHFVPAPSRAIFDGGGMFVRVLTAVALVSLATGFVLGPLNSVRFLLRRTTLNPNNQPSVFLTKGMYARSRNPMYLGLFLIYFGVDVMNQKAWPLATAVIPFLLLQRVIIPLEERYMAERFGDAYRDYCSRVRRWL
jgi:protein-S-isoprenylcysteine O-methyltransferase Ste14